MKLKICPSCQTLNPATQTYCGACGQGLNEHAQALQKKMGDSLQEYIQSLEKRIESLEKGK